MEKCKMSRLLDYTETKKAQTKVGKECMNLTEYEYGKGAVKVCGKIMLMSRDEGMVITGLVFPNVITD